MHPNQRKLYARSIPSTWQTTLSPTKNLWCELDIREHKKLEMFCMEHFQDPSTTVLLDIIRKGLMLLCSLDKASSYIMHGYEQNSVAIQL